MIRCVKPLTTALAVMLVLAAASPPAWSQVPRQFPPTALRGEVIGVAPPHVLLNGRPARLAAGARIRGLENRFELIDHLAGKKLIVNYTVEDTSGQLMELWVLTASEISNQPWPVTREQARSWLFEPVTQKWTKP